MLQLRASHRPPGTSGARSSRLRSIALCAAALTLGASVGASRPSATETRRVQGLTFTLRVRLTTPTATGNLYMALRGSSANGTTRLDPMTVVGPNAPVDENEYYLVTDTITYAVNPRTKTWSEKSIETGTLITMMRSMNSGNTISGFSVVVDSLGAGEPIEGRPTRHFRATYQYTINGGETPSTTTAAYEYWLADLPMPLKNPLDGRIKPFGAEKALMTDMLPKLLAAWGKMGPGTAVKALANTTIGTQKYVRTIDLTNVKAADVDAASLVIPAGFRRSPAGRGRGGE